jgi:hypothetical protein
MLWPFTFIAIVAAYTYSLKTEAALSPYMLANNYQTTWRYIPEYNLQENY